MTTWHHRPAEPWERRAAVHFSSTPPRKPLAETAPGYHRGGDDDTTAPEFGSCGGRHRSLPVVQGSFSTYGDAAFAGRGRQTRPSTTEEHSPRGEIDNWPPGQKLAGGGGLNPAAR